MNANERTRSKKARRSKRVTVRLTRNERSRSYSGAPPLPQLSSATVTLMPSLLRVYMVWVVPRSAQDAEALCERFRKLSDVTVRVERERQQTCVAALARTEASFAAAHALGRAYVAQSGARL